MQELNLRHPTPEVGALSTELIAQNLLILYKLILNIKFFFINIDNIIFKRIFIALFIVKSLFILDKFFIMAIKLYTLRR